MASSSEITAYQKWRSLAVEDPDLQAELVKIERDDEAIHDRFYCDLSFGTAGLRGVIGAGTNRINIYVIRKTTQALAEYLLTETDSPSVAVSYDSRIKSDLFAREAASVLAANGVKVYIYRNLMPVPCLSFAVRRLSCQAGIMITASHNPAKYNGYKVYAADGAQISPDTADKILKISSKLDMFDGAKRVDFETALKEEKIQYIPESVEEEYLSEVKKRSIHPELLREVPLKVVYTPLNGAGNQPVRKLLSQMGVEDIHVVKEQELPNGEFPTCPYPNPEIREALSLGLRDCEKLNADLLIATDPDCDRMGIAVRDSKTGGYQLLSGNETGVLMFEYICRERTNMGTMPKKAVAVKTVVSTDLTRKIAEHYGVDLKNVLTGFKYIGEQIGILEEKGEEDRFIFGFEESYGYLAGSYVRDKDGVIAAMLVYEVAAFYHKQGKTLLDALKNIYETYGVYRQSTVSFLCEGESGMEKMAQIMEDIRSNPPKSIGNLPVISWTDYSTSVMENLKSGEKETISLPKSNILEFELEQGARVILRPSGTEPKLKVYYTAQGETTQEAEKVEKNLQDDFTKKLGF